MICVCVFLELIYIHARDLTVLILLLICFKISVKSYEPFIQFIQ